jgi:CRISPR-associated protein Csm5
MSLQARIIPFVTYRVTIQFLSPVHVGSGHILDPYEYVTRRDDSGQWLVIFDQAAMLADLPENKRQQFLQLCDRADHVQLRRFFQIEVKSQHERWRIALDQGTFDEIQRNVNNPNRMGNIHLFTRDWQTGSPYLPGSSIKGAIRTAIVDHLLQQLPDETKEQLRQKYKARPDYTPRGPQFEAEVLGHFRDGTPDLYSDPFKQLAVADAPLPPEAMRIHRVQLVGSQGRGQGAEGILMYRDVVMPWLGTKPVVVQTEVRWHKRFLSEVMGHKRLPREITPADICRACNDFYRPRYDKEREKFPVPSGGTLSGLPDETGTGCLLRLGGHSHFECMTVSPPFSQPPRRGVGRSRTRIDGKTPLGWVYLEFHDT